MDPEIAFSVSSLVLGTAALMVGLVLALALPTAAWGAFWAVPFAGAGVASILIGGSILDQRRERETSDDH